MPDRLRVLILEDRPADAELLVHELRRAGFALEWERVETEAQYLARLHPGLDVVLADYSLPGFDAPRALALLKTRDLDLPLIVVSGSASDERAAECIKLGAADYLLKDRLARLGAAVTQALEARRLRAQRRQAEDALRESEERFRSAFEESAVGMALQAFDGRYLRVNRALCALLGYSPEELLATTFHVVTHPEDRETDSAEDHRMLAGEVSSLQREKRYLHKRGHVVWALATISLVRDRAGQPLAFLAQVQDITTRREAGELQARLQAQLVQSEKLAAMGSLLAGVAHELNNPLSVVIGQAALLRYALGEGPSAARVDKIATAASRCARIVKNFLALAREHPPERVDVPLNQVVREAVELLAYPLRLDNVEVTLDLAPDVPLLWADPHQLHQVVVNLVSNAHQALREAPEPRRLILATRRDGARGVVRLDVADTGPGIPAEIRGRIFEPFFTTKPPGQGTGLGLSLCHGIVEGHGGTIAVQSELGRGATFRVELPVTARPAAVPAIGLAPAPPDIAGKRILVVDDEPEVAAVLADLLTEQGHEVETAPNGEAALARIGADTYDLIVTDMKMPALDGPGFYCAATRRDPAVARRFVFVTGDGLSPQIRQFLDRAREPRLSKPFDLAEVHRVVRQALQAQAAP